MTQVDLQNPELTEQEAVAELKELFTSDKSKELERQSDLIMLFEPLEFDDEELSALCNTDEFTKGYKLGAELIGLYSVMVNGGMDGIVANNIVTNHHAMYVNIETQKIINEGVKIQSTAIKKGQL